MRRHYYSDTITQFLFTKASDILGTLAYHNEFSLEQTQRDAWMDEISILQKVLLNFQGSLYFEYSIPRMGRRIDVVLIIGPVIFVLEFKVGGDTFETSAMDQVFDYALDLKNFHKSSHDKFIAPILIATKAKTVRPVVSVTPQNDKLLFPIKSNTDLLEQVIKSVLAFTDSYAIDPAQWDLGQYCPTPTIVEAAMALYSGHSVAEISRSDASASNLTETSDSISDIIQFSRDNTHKSICFVPAFLAPGRLWLVLT